MTRLILAAMAVLVLTGCSVPSPYPTTYPGQDANAIAAMIEGCEHVTTEDVGDGDKSGLVSSASCMLNGHKVYINSWDSEDSADLHPLLAANGEEAYYATGDAWTVTLGDDPTLQYQLTNNAAELMFGENQPANVDAERTMAETVVASLGGTVEHISG
jgi:hypothetical protein